jgi:hypothetical protein
MNKNKEQVLVYFSEAKIQHGLERQVHRERNPSGDDENLMSAMIEDMNC